MRYIVLRAKQALDLNKNGKVDWWEVVTLFIVTLVVSMIVNFLFY